jgi:succinoglycan biosynthesis transport protein ExoP
MAFVILRRLLDGSIRTPDQIEAMGLKCIALVPGLRYEQPRRPDVSRLDLLLKPELADTIPDRVKARFVLESPLSRFTEQFRAIKSELAIAELHEPVTCLGFASGAPGEGKSTLASNLAFLYAASGVRTLLIDGDLRNPSLSRTLAPGATVGLSDVRADFECLPDALQRDPSGVMFLPANVAQVNDPGDLLGSPAMERLLKAARKNFDRVIVDLPPVGPVSGARTASRLLDSLIIVAEWRSTHAQALTATVEAFGHDRRKLLGCVINAVDFRSLGPHATYYYGTPSFPADTGLAARGTEAA